MPNSFTTPVEVVPLLGNFGLQLLQLGCEVLVGRGGFREGLVSGLVLCLQLLELLR
ncbi:MULTISPECIES: hypothetical protein [unclassified Arthrobacter]|uniref:hypothetical protein n=1 Tax=unclassified Arthrobacter TaxID=235627 RepID=UPI00339867DA